MGRRELANRTTKKVNWAEEVWAKALFDTIDKCCRDCICRRMRCDDNTHADNVQAVFERILTDVRKMKVDLERLKACPDYEREVVRRKVEAVRSKLRRDREKAKKLAVSLADCNVSTTCRDREQFEAKEYLTTVLERVALSKQERMFVALYLAGLAPEAQAEALGVTKTRLAKLKYNTLAKLKPLIGDLITNYIE